jgi:hypothetical protein
VKREPIYDADAQLFLRLPSGAVNRCGKTNTRRWREACSAARSNIIIQFFRCNGVRSALAVLPLIFAQAAWGTFGGTSNESVLSSASVPAVEGTVRATACENGNKKLEARVKHLAPATRVASDASVYVVWVKPRDGEVQNAGALLVDADVEGKRGTTTSTECSRSSSRLSPARGSEAPPTSPCSHPR